MHSVRALRAAVGKQKHLVENIAVNTLTYIILFYNIFSSNLS